MTARPDHNLAEAERLLRQAAALDGDDQEREELLGRAMTLCLPLAVSMAHRYRRRGEPDEDLEQVAALAVVKAVRRYVPQEHTSLAGFAVPTIHGELKRYFRDATWTLRPPRRLQELRIAAHVVQGELTQALGRPPSDAELARRLGVDETEVREMQVASSGYSPSPLDVEAVDVRGSVPDGAPEIENLLDLDAALPALDALPDRDRRVVAMRFYGGLSQQQIADRVGVSQVQVSRILAAALRTVREAVQV
ncbi:sigma-70 family RNA polymerase sigma factor [Spongisporangium articulatum]|uniref:Sigma-70 family RNA polymerase sigma factor n=1 Tax=Spongisporangium articulatum TaxID=3362603 RepID=A0ABW8ARX8_9ACTN